MTGHTMKPEPSKRVEGCAESLPGVCMSDRAHYAQPRFWDKIILGRPLSDEAIARYQRAGKYGRAVLKAPGDTALGQIVWSA